MSSKAFKLQEVPQDTMCDSQQTRPITAIFQVGVWGSAIHVQVTTVKISYLATSSALRGDRSILEYTTSEAAPTSPREGVLRHMQHMQAVGTHYGPSLIYGPTGHAITGTAQLALQELIYRCYYGRALPVSVLTAGRVELHWSSRGMQTSDCRLTRNSVDWNSHETQHPLAQQLSSYSQECGGIQMPHINRLFKTVVAYSSPSLCLLNLEQSHSALPLPCLLLCRPAAGSYVGKIHFPAAPYGQ